MAAGSDLGIRPHGLQALFALRLEKGHVIVGMDTEMDSTPRRLNMEWAVKLDKPDFIGRTALLRTAGLDRPPPAVRPDIGRPGADRGRADLGRRRDRRPRHVELPLSGARQDGDARLAEAHAVRRLGDDRRPPGDGHADPVLRSRGSPCARLNRSTRLRVVAKPAALDGQ